MGLSSLPTPSEGVICVLQSILHTVGIHLASSSPPSSDSVENPTESFEFRHTNSDSYIEEFRSRTPAIRFDTVCSCKRPDHKCSICLARFEPESEINRLKCDHLFHKACLEKWLNYRNACPLCLIPLMREQDASYFW